MEFNRKRHNGPGHHSVRPDLNHLSLNLHPKDLTLHSEASATNKADMLKNKVTPELKPTGDGFGQENIEETPEGYNPNSGGR